MDHEKSLLQVWKNAPGPARNIMKFGKVVRDLTGRTKNRHCTLQKCHVLSQEVHMAKWPSPLSIIRHVYAKLALTPHLGYPATPTLLTHSALSIQHQNLSLNSSPARYRGLLQLRWQISSLLDTTGNCDMHIRSSVASDLAHTAIALAGRMQSSRGPFVA